jgi:hypothetical protein
MMCLDINMAVDADMHSQTHKQRGPRFWVWLLCCWMCLPKDNNFHGQPCIPEIFGTIRLSR